MNETLIHDFTAAMSLDQEWSVTEAASVVWWPWMFAQRLEIQPPLFREGMSLHRTTVSTDVHVAEFPTEQAALEYANALNRASTLAAVLAEKMPESKGKGLRFTFTCRSATTLHQQALDFNWRLLKIAAVLQLDLATNIVSAQRSACPDDSWRALVATSSPPHGFVRELPDEMTLAAMSLCRQTALQPNGFSGTFERTRAILERLPNKMSDDSLTANESTLSISGKRSGQRFALMLRADIPHPRYGQGLLCLLFMQDSRISPMQAMALNRELTGRAPLPGGFGAWVSDENGQAAWNCFVPAFAFEPSVLPNMASHGLALAHAAASLLEVG